MNPQVNQINQKLFITPYLAHKIHAEAGSNKAFNAVCHHFAMRERSRQQITLSSLNKSMQKEGFKFDKGEYARSLRFLNALGIGELDMDLKGRLRSIKKINVALQTIAIAALNKEASEQPVPPPGKITKALKTQIPTPKEDTHMAVVAITAEGKTFTKKIPLDVAVKYFFSLMEDTTK